MPLLVLPQPHAVVQLRLPPALDPGLRAAIAAVIDRPPSASSLDRIIALCTAALAADAVHPTEHEPALAKDRVGHDTYFRIGRSSEGAPARAVLRAVLHTYILFAREVAEGGTTLPPAPLADVDGALSAILAMLLDRPSVTPARVAAWPAEGATPSALRRWIRGHQLFAVLTQGLLIALDRLAAAVDPEAGADPARLTDAAADVTRLLAGSAGALRFTGDFRAEEYCGAIRPTMLPPQVPDGFSGVMASDHRVLVARLKEMRPVWSRLQTVAPASHAAIAAALARVYEDHKSVCAKFVGTDRPSLLSVAAPDQRSGVEQLDQFRQARLRLLRA